MRAPLAALALLVLAAAPAAADCDGSQAEMTECAGNDFHQADAALNAAYGKLAARLDAPGKIALRDAQRAWLAFRDKQCLFMASGVAGGSIYPMIRANCLTTETMSRTKAFQGILTCPEGDLSCP